jgi:hypothetical protein
MSRGEDQHWKNGDEYYNVGGAWICDVCGEEEPPNHFMVEPFGDGQHICKICLTKHIVEYFELNYWPEIIHLRDKAHVISCFEFNPKKRKKYVPLKLRKKVLLAGKCKHCGSKDNLQVDHIIPYSKGGATQLDNLQCLCGKCNSKKGDKINHDDLKRILPKGANHS